MALSVKQVALILLVIVEAFVWEVLFSAIHLPFYDVT
jgi:hypothetical protein